MLAPIRIRPQAPAVDPNLVPVEFNARSKALLEGVNPTLAELMTAVEAQHPDSFEIGEGMRTRDRQAQMVAEGKSQTMNSKHLGGNAVDIAIEDYRPLADTAKAVAAQMGIPNFVWGGDWRTLKDGVHFQVGGPPMPPGEGGSVSAGGVPLSFGADTPAVQDPSAMGLASMFGTGGPGGLDLGSLGLAPKRPGAEQMLLAQAQQESDMKRKIALADLMRF